MHKNLIIITGSSKGLGKALVELFLKNAENKVVGISRSGLGEKDENYVDFQVDLTDPQKVVSAFDSIFPQGNYEEVILINNAGWIGDIAPFGKLEPSGIWKIHMVNTVAPALLMNEFVHRYGRENLNKVVVNISSGAAEKNIDGWSGYSSSKAALNRFTEIAQEESNMHGFNIRYFALSPGIIDTPMQKDIRSAKEEDFSRVSAFKEFKANRELAIPEDVAEKVAHLILNKERFEGVVQDVRQF
jgi:benzil reductase ((S)-benzoin forming)